MTNNLNEIVPDGETLRNLSTLHGQREFIVTQQPLHLAISSANGGMNGKNVMCRCQLKVSGEGNFEIIVVWSCFMNVRRLPESHETGEKVLDITFEEPEQENVREY